MDLYSLFSDLGHEESSSILSTELSKSKNSDNLFSNDDLDPSDEEPEPPIFIDLKNNIQKNLYQISAQR